MLKSFHLKKLLTVTGAVLLLVAVITVKAETVLEIGATGKAVSEIQEYLYRLKYLKGRADGQYGQLTAAAVKSFQLEHALPADGKVGADTLEALRAAVNEPVRVVEHLVAPGETLAGIAQEYNSSSTAIMVKNKLATIEVTSGQKLLIPTGGAVVRLNSRGKAGGIQVIPWSIVTQLWEKGETALVTDVSTGRSFRARRLYGSYHADVEPLTRQDTETMLAVYGGKWSWDRRAVVIQLRNLYIAASMNGMPHGEKSIAGNGFPGQFCIHFLGSRVHQDGQVDPAHLTMIEQAALADLELITKEVTL